MHGRFALYITAASLLLPSPGITQDPLETPLRQEVLTRLTNEVSGQMAFNNLVKLAGAPWIRRPEEFTDTFDESAELHRLVQGYGIETVRFDQYPGPGTFTYPTEGELWILEPEPRLIARLGADVAMIARGSQSGEATGDLMYVPPVSAEEIRRMGADGRMQGTVALMWSHPRGDAFQALDELGVRAVISFSTRDRYLDPNQVVYSGGGYGEGESLRMGMTISWRQWSELLEDVERGQEMVVRLQAVIEEHPNKFETVFAWIPGTEPDAKGVIFTGHLFEGYTKRGTNDNMGGPAIQLEILRALHHLIESGQLPRPRRTISFLWPNEISGTYEFIRREPGLLDRLSININMDMVSEGLRNSNAVFTMSETPEYIPSYLDGLAKSVLNYVWRTNDIVYLPDSPRGRPGGQYFPQPMMEKNGSTDAFRFFIHETTGGSDHICFNNSSVAIPGIEFFTWPDTWYHADTDLPDKADPTEMKRVAFIGAATALAAADLTDDRLTRLLDAVSDFGYSRVAARGLPRALAIVDDADGQGIQRSVQAALHVVNAAIDREVGALESIREIYTSSTDAEAAVSDRVTQWELYRNALHDQVMGYGQLRAERMGTRGPTIVLPGAQEQRYAEVVFDLHPDVRGQQFSLTRSESYRTYVGANPSAMTDLGLTSAQTRQIPNFVNGSRSVTAIRNRVAAATGTSLTVEQVAGYLAILEVVGWVVMK
jgi:hypothetical protein